jgi:hypothetical protein
VPHVSQWGVRRGAKALEHRRTEIPPGGTACGRNVWSIPCANSVLSLLRPVDNAIMLEC